ncbi:MAG: hypothetical protein ACKO37_01460 [Vampirovibrionales bacterium]
MATTPVCPILSIGKESTEPMQLCLADECAFYLPQVKKCSVVYMGFNALLQSQTLQKAQQTSTPPKS